MIAHITGKLLEKTPTHVIVDVNGIGYIIHISVYTFSKIQEKEACTFLTYLHIRDDAHTLYGFITQEEKEVFLLLIKVNGISANLALTILSSLSPYEIHQATIHDNAMLISSVKGIGKKIAERIILELKDKFQKLNIVCGTNNQVQPSIHLAATNALIKLGISKTIAEKSIQNILKNHSENISIEELIRLALKNA